MRSSLTSPASTIVVGDGLAGASVAAALARRGHRVRVFGSGDQPASGASGLPAGIVAPHLSAADLPVSQLSRLGVAHTFACARHLLREGVDFAQGGVLERRVQRALGLPAPTSAVAAAPLPGARPMAVPSISSAPASQSQLAAWPAQHERERWPFVWHVSGGWLRPASLVRALLATPGVEWTGNGQVERVGRDAQSPWIDWNRGDHTPGTRLRAAQVVLAGGAAGADLLRQLDPRWHLFPVRGQVSLGAAPAPLREELSHTCPVPVNGHGSWICGVPLAELGDAPGWICGSTFERRVDTPDLKPQDHQANLERLAALIPSAARQLATDFAEGAVRGWAGVRCTTADRLPVVGPVHPDRQGLWVSTAMGSRGLTLAVLCGEALAARICNEPPVLPPHLEAAIDSLRTLRPDAPAAMP